MRSRIPPSVVREGGEFGLERRPESLTSVVFDAIREAIISKTLPPGSRVTEASLAERLNVSKTPVREALLKLREVGLIEPDGRRGGRIVRPSRDSIRYAYEVREALEVFAARTAARHSENDWSKQISEFAERCLAAAEAGDLDGFRQWDEAFHASVADATGNPRLIELIDDVFAVILTLRGRDVPATHFTRDCARAHVRIAQEISAGDAAAAASAMERHVVAVRDSVLSAFADETSDDAPPRTGARRLALDAG